MSFRLLHYSDPHFGAYVPGIAAAAVETAHQLAPDLTVVSGDFSMRGRRFEFGLAKEWLAALPKPLITYPGNHDVPGLNQPLDRFFSPFRRFRKYISEVEEPTAKLGDVGAFASANSSTPFGLHLDWSRGFLSPMQLLAMESFFEDLPADQLRVFGIHHPLLGSGEKARALVSPLSMVEGALEKARVDLVLAGHFHQSKIGVFPAPSEENERKRRLVVSQAPSICSTRLKGEPNGFHLLELSGEEISIELWRWDQERFVPQGLRTFRCGEQGWEEAQNT